MVFCWVCDLGDLFLNEMLKGDGFNVYCCCLSIGRERRRRKRRVRGEIEVREKRGRKVIEIKR